MQLIVITGLSGSGKSVALKALEDSAYYAADNLPAKLLPEMIALLERAGHQRIAISIDARSGDTLAELPQQISALRASASCSPASARFPITSTPAISVRLRCARGSSSSSNSTRRA